MEVAADQFKSRAVKSIDELESGLFADNLAADILLFNSSYREYSKETNMGQNYYAYSTIKYYDPGNFRFNL